MRGLDSPDSHGHGIEQETGSAGWILGSWRCLVQPGHGSPGTSDTRRTSWGSNLPTPHPSPRHWDVSGDGRPPRPPVFGRGDFIALICLSSECCTLG